MAPLVANDWGTSSLRGARLGDDGTVLEQRNFARGILTVPAGGFQWLKWVRPGRIAIVPGLSCET